MAEETKTWEGKSRGNLSGHMFFVYTLKIFGLRFAFFFLRFVAFYFFLFDKNRRFTREYFEKVHGFSGLKARWAVYKTYYIFGQTLIDKVAVMTGKKNLYTINHDGHHYLQKTRDMQKGGILVSAHLGNWEIAGQLLNMLETRFNILMYDNEMAQMKNFMNQVLTHKKINIIGIKDGDMGHLVELHKAFSNNEWVVMHGDRFRPGAQFIEKDFLGRKARFPLGPFIMAAKFGVPLVVVFAVKETPTHYHFFANEPIVVKRCRTEEEIKEAVKMLSDFYVSEVEKMVRKYPYQWFNFYDFWA